MERTGCDPPSMSPVHRRLRLVIPLAPTPQFSLYSAIEPGTNRGYVMIANMPAMRCYVQLVMGDR
jgi:hypothetical protein